MAVKNRTARSPKSKPAGRTARPKAVPVEAQSETVPPTKLGPPRTTTRYDVVINGTEVIAELLTRHSAESFVASWNEREIGERMPAKLVPVTLQEVRTGVPTHGEKGPQCPDARPRVVTLFEMTSHGEFYKFELEEYLAEVATNTINDIMTARAEYHGRPKPELLPATFKPVRFVELPEEREDSAPSEVVLYHVILSTGECIHTGTDQECAAFQQDFKSKGESRDLPELKVVAELFRAVRLEGGAH